MGTWFDMQRAVTQGRIVPNNVDAVDGSRVFVLGADGMSEPAILVADDYTQIKQTIDVTTVDVVAASLQTIGVAMAQFEYPVGFEVDANTLLLYPMDRNIVDAPNARAGYPHLLGQGDLVAAQESYSSLATYCRRIPASSSTAQLLGENTPQLWSSSLGAYSLQFWMNFDATAHQDSNGVDPTVFELVSAGVGGLVVILKGVTGIGAQEWYLEVRHVDGASEDTQAFTSYLFTTANVGWKLISIIYDSSETGAAKLKLYIDDGSAINADAEMTVDAGAASAGAAITVAHPSLTGYIDQMRLLNVARTAVEVASDYGGCTAQTINDATWVMSWLVDGTTYAERTIEDGEERIFSDFRIPVKLLTGDHEVALRLQLKEVP